MKTSDEKKTQIKQSLMETREKRTHQICKVYQTKLDFSRLNNQQLEQLKMIFIEAKWLTNSILNYSKSEKIRNYNTNSNIITKKDKDLKDVEVELKYISSQMKQSIQEELISNIKTLSILKKNGYKVGGIKFKKEVKSINLKQYGITYKIISSKKIKLQGVQGKLPVNGLDQFISDPEVEFANAKLLNSPDGYYLKITTYKNKEIKTHNGKILGIDFGCSTSLTTSEEEKISVSIQESDRLKKLSRKISRQVKGSKNRWKTRKLLQVEYQHLSNKKDDLANKIVAKFLEYDKIYIQDEQLQSWAKNGHGKVIQYSVLGRIKSRLIRHENVVVLSKWEPTTKLCRICGNKVELKQSDRIFRCNCGVVEDRDIHAAKNMIYLGQLGTEYTENKPVETNTSLNLEIDSKVWLMKQEDATSLA
jgi:putative transposase